MDVLFLGYQILDFVNKEGEVIKGVKFQFAFKSEKRGYNGFESASYFADYERDRLLHDMILKCSPMEHYHFVLTPSFSGKTKIESIGSVKSA